MEGYQVLSVMYTQCVKITSEARVKGIRETDCN